MRQRITEADLRRFLEDRCVPLDADVLELRERIQALLASGDEAHRAAHLLVEHGIHGQAIGSLEEVIMRFGEAIALAFGRRIAEGEGYHWKAAELVRIYCAVFRPDLSRQAAQVQRLRERRNKVKYLGEIVGPTDLAVFSKVVDDFIPAFRAEPIDRLLRNHGRPGSRP